MFRHLRLLLTSLYLLAALLLLILIGGGTYQLVDNYFQTNTDSAMQHKMAHEFTARGIAEPAALAAADQEWYASEGLQPPSQARSPAPAQSRDGDADDHSGHTQTSTGNDDRVAIENAYGGDLASIYTLPLDANGHVLTSAMSTTVNIQPNQDAVASALANGVDWRTVQLDGETRVRLLTYRLPQVTTSQQGSGTPGMSAPGAAPPAFIQMGRLLSDQDGVLQRLIMGMLALGGVSIFLLGFASWWLAGRSLKPAQEAWERQQHFIANASHELRAPLTLMRASTEVALRTTQPKDEDQRALLHDVLQECDHMNRLVEDLLLLSRLDAGHVKLERQAIRLDDMLADVQRQVGRIAAERGIRLMIGDQLAMGGGQRAETTDHRPPTTVTHQALHAAHRPVPTVALGDPTRLRQVLLILLDNAMQYTPPGGTIEIMGAAHGRHVELVVEDTGKGIPPEHLPHIFERFYRVEEARGEEGKGNGLGLSIAKGLVEAQGGHIAITSKPGQGTRITISLHAASEVGSAPPVKVQAPV
jgi:signal transduction histidine kinase